VERWHLPSIEANGKREPRVLFSSSACRAVVIDLKAGDEMREHQVHEHAVLEVLSGRVALAAGGDDAECGPGTLASFDPGERRTVLALEPSRILLLLAPWPGDGHFGAGEDADPKRMPAQGSVQPLGSSPG
jgi:quercetin dioxygenase-like cupin family protein